MPLAASCSTSGLAGEVDGMGGLGEACGFSKWCTAIMLVLLKLLDFYMSGGSKIVVLMTMEDRTGCKYPRVQPGAHIWISYSYLVSIYR